MARMSDLLDTIRRDIDLRLEELRPHVEEAARLQGAFDALATINGQAGTAASPRARARTQAPASTPRGETRRRIVGYLRANPGSTAGDVAHALGLNRRSTSTRLTQLAKAGDIMKAERGYSPAK
jgi:predicted transcriptional regulator